MLNEHRCGKGFDCLDRGRGRRGSASWRRKWELNFGSRFSQSRPRGLLLHRRRKWFGKPLRSTPNLAPADNGQRARQGNKLQVSTLLYLIRDLGRLFISENFPLLVGLITLWSLIFSKDFILLVVYYIVVADQDVIVDDESAIQPWSKSPKKVTKSNRGQK